MTISHSCGEILTYSYVQNVFNSVMLEMFEHGGPV